MIKGHWALPERVWRPHCGPMDTASPSIFPPRRVLVAFATKHGSTGEIARTIGAGLARQASRWTCCLWEQAERIDDYRAVLVGGRLGEERSS